MKETISWKPAVYLLDGSNFYMSVFYPATCLPERGHSARNGWPGFGKFPGDRDSAERKFVEWVKFASANVGELAASSFRVYLDGEFRKLSDNTANVAFVFSDFSPADEGLLEYAAFCASSGKRAIAVSNDRELVSKIKETGIKTLSCDKFFRMVEKKLK